MFWLAWLSISFQSDRLLTHHRVIIEQPMTRTASAALIELSQLAGTQGGFLTAAQAAAAGVRWQTLNRLTKQGFLEREMRGLYRLSHFPVGEDAELWRALLWPAVDRADGIHAILCYATALSLYDVSTINPGTIDVAVPRPTRIRRSTVPPPGLQLHQKSYPSEDIATAQGLPATTLFRTIADLIATKRALQFIDEALENPRTRTLLTTKEFETLKAMRSLDQRALTVLRA
ncbi:MAG: hypothetical protein JO103_14195 [Candidatus Eremiobacteraeota bacterium]|nr:hypothetical protein [Candidatus Eremiobacteraeota bacterium]MBV9407434.1 hypothetical protein [Candidatus Eremiobacteraeota bacterium]